MCNQDHLQNIPLTSLYGYLSRRIEAYLATLLRPYGLGVEQMIALMILSKRGCINVSSLSELLLKDKTTTSRLITSLESKGFVKKCHTNKNQSKKDKRIVYVELTKIGQQKIKEIESSEIKTQMDKIFENALSASQKESLKSVLLRVLGVLDEKH